MSNKEITVINTNKEALRKEIRSECECYVYSCLEDAKAPAKRIAFSVIDYAFNWLIDYMHDRFAA